jgi:hypothetical protein
VSFIMQNFFLSFNEWGEPVASYIWPWTGWVWEITSWGKLPIILEDLWNMPQIDKEKLKDHNMLVDWIWKH